MVTIIIPSYNYARFLPEALESALAQAGPDLEVEVLVVDDGSTDETPQVAARYGDRIHYHRKENAGLSAARNTGMALARHDLVLFLDADDILLPGALDALMKARENITPSPAVLASKFVAIDANGRPLDAAFPESTGELKPISARDLVIRNRFATTVLSDRRILVSLGGFDTNLRACEDRDLWIRVAAVHRVMFFDHLTLKIRKHGSNMSKSAERQTNAIQQVLRKAFTNPSLILSFADRLRARSICHYQSALMFHEAGMKRTALYKMLLSVVTYPGMDLDDSIPNFTRVRRLALLATNLVRLKS